MKQNFWKIPTNISNTRQKLKHLPEVQAHAQPPTHAHTEEGEGNNKTIVILQYKFARRHNICWHIWVQVAFLPEVPG